MVTATRIPTGITLTRITAIDITTAVTGGTGNLRERETTPYENENAVPYGDGVRRFTSDFAP